MNLEQLIPAISLIAVLILVLPAFIKTNSNLKQFLKNNFFMIDHFGIDGDFIESQAFAYLAVRSLYGKFISYPSTTKVKKAISGGELIEIT